MPSGEWRQAADQDSLPLVGTHRRDILPQQGDQSRWETRSGVQRSISSTTIVQQRGQYVMVNRSHGFKDHAASNRALVMPTSACLAVLLGSGRQSASLVRTEKSQARRRWEGKPGAGGPSARYRNARSGLTAAMRSRMTRTISSGE